MRIGWRTGRRFVHVCALQVRSWSLCNCVTGLTQQGCISLPTISHRRCRACQTEEAVSGWATSSPLLEGDFMEPGKPLQIGRRRAAPLPRSSLLRGLGSALLKGEQRQEPWGWNGGGETRCSPFESRSRVRWWRSSRFTGSWLGKGEHAAVARSPRAGRYGCIVSSPSPWNECDTRSGVWQQRESTADRTAT